MPKSEQVIGRKAEKRLLDIVLASKDPELMAVYGRRRVGKTYLLREHLKSNLVFEFSGIHNQSTAMQLANFHVELRRAFPNIASVSPSTWIDAFELLRQALTLTSVSNRKRVIFIDEFPWIATRKSGFLAAFENFWNTFASRERDLAVVICGSAAAWMIRNIVNSRGGLHNRLTRRMKLDPFRLCEVQEYLRHRKIRWDEWQIALIYMAMGGIPHYLNLIQPGQSAAQCIDAECFRKEGLLRNEYQNLYAALFESYATHEAIIKALASSWSGLTRDEILLKAQLSSGGGVTKALDELLLSGFISETVALNNKSKGGILRLSDEFSLFHFHWMQSPSQTQSWLRRSSSRRYESWCGYAFESLCFKHLDEIRAAIGISDVETNAASWRYVPRARADDEGAQIDLLLDRADHCINICEVKFSNNRYVITKRYAADLERKLRVFQSKSNRKATDFLTMITPHGIAPNQYSEQLITNEVTLSDLFAK